MYLLKYETEEKLMSLTRRNFLIRSSFSLAAGAFSSVLVEAKTKESAPDDFEDWESVRRHGMRRICGRHTQMVVRSERHWVRLGEARGLEGNAPGDSVL